MPTKTTLAVTIAPVVASALLGASFRLLLYPQVVIGSLLLLLGVTMKLAAAWIGILVLFATVSSGLVLAFALNARLAKGLPSVLVKLVNRLVPVVVGRARKLPVWSIVVVGFGAPAFGQLYASFAMVRMLVFVGAKSSPLSVGMFTGASVLVTVLVQVLGVVSSAWLKPGKISFLLQSFWILRVVLSGGLMNPDDKTKSPVWPFLSTVLMGWGSVILSSLPDRAVLEATQSAMKAALVSGGLAAASITGVAMKRAKDNNASATKTLLNVVEQLPDQANVPMDEPLLGEDSKLKRDVVNALKWFGDVVERTTARVKDQAQPHVSALFSKISNASSHALDGAAAVVEAATETPTETSTEIEDAAEIYNATMATIPKEDMTPLPDSETTEPDQPPLALALLLGINPPLSVAVFISILRAVPTIIVFAMAETIALTQFALGSGGTNGVAFPFVLFPFALAEAFALVRAVGFKRGLTSLFRLSANQSTDGMSVLLWQSPKLLAAWMQFKQADARLTSVGGNLLSMLLYPRAILFPSEEAIANAPKLTAFVWLRLVLSIIVDIIGVLTFTFPLLGEIFDVIWAPISAIIIQLMHGSSGFAFLGFAEEILPFTDVLPTATIAWIWMNGQFIPVWLIRIKRKALVGGVVQKKMQ